MIWKKKKKLTDFWAIYKTMLSYCLRSRKNRESKKPKVEKIKTEK